MVLIVIKKEHGIKAILTCAKGYRVEHPESEVPHYKYIAALDSDGFDLSPYFEECV